MKLIFLAVFMTLCIPPLTATPCKTVVRVKQQAMNYACQTQRRPLQKAFGLIAIPDVSQNIGGGGLLGNIFGAAQNLIGKVLNIVGIKILQVNLPDLDVKLMPRVGVQVSVDTGLHIQGRVLLLGGIEIKVGAGVLADVRVSKTAKGFPILAVSACKSILGEIQVTAGGFSLIPTIVKVIQGHIHAILSDRLCLTVSNVFLGMNADLGLMAHVTPITGDLEMQYTMPSPPVVTGDYMDMDMNVEYKVQDQVIELPSSANDFTLPPGAGSENSMVNMGFSEDFFIAMFTAIHSSGGFNMEKSAGFIKQKYTQSLPVNLKIVVTETPDVLFSSSQLLINLSPQIEMFVVLQDSHAQHLLTLNVGVTFAAKLEVKGEKLKTSLSLAGDLSLAVASSSYGPCKTKISVLSGYVRAVFEKAFLVQINAEMSVGLALPSLPNVQLTDPVVTIEEDYAVMSCDLQYIK
ncbi:BPI fold-containing family B member 2 [Bombina bombina]|uniref:BPI fold-containing family B member 2 n=1 Tax=Bombina bombina TaxID=8345 RepID=UPI00235ADA76|nr:BPI fold-containing family B member 2 [Bombina bombina]